MRLLLVEDDSDHALLISRCLKQEFGLGVVIEVVQTGEEALERVTLGSPLVEPDLIVTDIRLPGLSGLELLHRLREAGDRRPIVLVTSSQEQQLAIKALRYGADDFVTKGSDFPENLVGAVIRAQEHARLQKELSQAQEHIAEIGVPLVARYGPNPRQRLSREYEATRAQLQDIGARLKKQCERLNIKQDPDPSTGP